jgi:polysaccharide deacetylase family protein (PEP-CTERM system associated)
MNILTFDIEDWWVYDYYKIGERRDYLPRLNSYLNKVLDLLDMKGFNATFFCLGEVADKYPEVIRMISDRNHHIGCHSFSHRFWLDANPKEVNTDTDKALAIIESITGRKVNAYRAPAFSITEQNKWILGILAEKGIKYDCSIFPSNRSHGGFPGFAQKKPSIVEINGVRIKEFPISTARICGKEIAYSGGGYFRLFPYWKIRSIIEASNYTMTYFHIGDFDKDKKKHFRTFEGESAISKYFKKYYGLRNSFAKFNSLLSDFDFLSVEQADNLINWEGQPVAHI